MLIKYNLSKTITENNYYCNKVYNDNQVVGSYQDMYHPLSAQGLRMLGSHKLYSDDHQYQVRAVHIVQSLLTSRFDLYLIRHFPKTKNCIKN